jgi:hypothetical protein
MAKPMQNPPLTYARLREVVHYDPLSGEFTWLVTMGSRAQKGQRAGCPGKGRHTPLMIDKVLYKAHRLAFFYMTERWPHELDHIDLDKGNNRWANLREATRSGNMANTPKRSTNTSGFKGVRWCAGKWNAQITVSGQCFYLGRFETKEEAHAVYVSAASQYFGDFARAG